MEEKNQEIFTIMEKIMVTPTEHNLIALLKSLGFDKETTVATVVLTETDEIREQMIEIILDRYEEKGEVTYQDIQKMLLMLIGERKQSNTDSMKTDTEK